MFLYILTFQVLVAYAQNPDTNPATCNSLQKNYNACLGAVYKSFMDLNCDSTCAKFRRRPTNCFDNHGTETCLKYLASLSNQFDACNDQTGGWRDFMKLNCAKTCRYCTVQRKEPTVDNCVDDAEAKCSLYEHKCSDPFASQDTRDYLLRYCPKLCQTCGSCKDKDEMLVCALERSLGNCNQESIKNDCPKSCGVCGSPEKKEPNTENCADSVGQTNNGNCQTFKDGGFCSDGSPGYSFMMQYCPKKCGFCSPLLAK